MRLRFFQQLILVGLLWRPGLGQDLLPILNFYNQAQYDSVLQLSSRFSKNYPKQAGLARYFGAESHYNKALISQREEEAVHHLNQAHEWFEAAAASPDLAGDFEDYLYFAKYKQAWCSFRLAEVLDSESMFERAYREFLANSAQSPDSLQAFSNYMAVESQLRALRLASWRPEDLNELETARSDELPAWRKRLLTLLRLSGTKAFAAGLLRFQAMAKFRAVLLDMEFADLYQLKVSTARTHVSRETRLYFSDQAGSLLNQLEITPESVPRSKFAAEISAYLNFMKALHLRYLTPGVVTAPVVPRASGSHLAAELVFRQANLLQTDWSLKSERASGIISAYRNAAAETESTYWLGYVAMVQGQTALAVASFEQFLAAVSQRKLGNREQVLVDDAMYRRSLLDFEKFYLSGSQGELRKLAAQLAEFNPANQSVGIRKQQLELLVVSSLTTQRQQLWNDVLSGSAGEKAEEALATVRFILPRAALNIGPSRERYLTLLNRLLALTVQERLAETTFFSGIVKSLEAEIQPTPGEKAKKFQDAAEYMSRIPDDFELKSEADYVAARSRFFADDIEHAASALKREVNQNRSLRALFYLGEWFRLEQNGAAARACFSRIVTTLQKDDFSNQTFWLANSVAAMQAVGDSGSLAALQDVNLKDIDFEPGRFPDRITYENLAEEGFLKQQAISESVAWLTVFGLPAKTLYPSRNTFANDLTPGANIFENLTAGIDEIRHSVRASLRLHIALPPGITGEPVVTIDGAAVARQEDSFATDDIFPGSERCIRVRQPGCYDFQKQQRFLSPRLYDKTIILNRQLHYVQMEGPLDAGEVISSPLLSERNGNLVLKSMPVLRQDSDLVQDFQRMTELRDLVVDSSHARILALHARLAEIWVYSNDDSSRRQGSLKPHLEEPLNWPEGLTILRDGTLLLADWGNHRIVSLDSEGKFLFQFGRFGTNDRANIGEEIKLTFPTRIITMPHNADEAAGEWRQKYFYIANQNGIHVCSAQGHYLDSLAVPAATMRRGAFYGLLRGTDHGRPTLYLANHFATGGKRILEFVTK